MSAKPGAPRREETSTTRVKNTTLHLNGQNLRLAAKNGRDSKTPGPRLSATHGRETAGRLTAPSPTREGAAPQLGSSPLKSPRHDSQREAESRPLRRPPKLAPLELPEEVREAQRQRLKFIQREANAATRKLDARVAEPPAGQSKPCARQSLVKAAGCPPASTEPPRVQQQRASSRPRLTRSVPVEQGGDQHLGDVVCRGTPAPLRRNPAPPLLSQRVNKAQAEVARKKTHSAPPPEEGRQRLRLRRAQCPEEDQADSNASTTGGLAADKGELARGVQGKGQRAERGRRESSRMLENAPRSIPGPPRSIPRPPRSIPGPPGSSEAPSGKAIKRTAVGRLQDAVPNVSSCN